MTIALSGARAHRAGTAVPMEIADGRRVITVLELRDTCAAVLDAVEAGESLTITRGGTPVAVIGPVPRKPTFVNTDEMRRIFALSPNPDYAQLRADIDEFFGDDDRIRDEDCS